MCRPDLKSSRKLNSMTAAWVYVHKQVLSSYPLISHISSAKQVTSRKMKVCTDIYVSHNRTKQQNIFILKFYDVKLQGTAVKLYSYL